MKKTVSLFAVAAVAALSLNLAAGLTTVSADTTTDTQDTTATIELTPAKDKDGNDATITLDAAPNIDFGSKTIDASNSQTYTAESISDALTVTNPGVYANWAVSAKASKFATTGGVELKGAVLTLGNGTAASTTADNRSVDATAAGATTLSEAASGDIFSAAAGAGVGTWNDSFDKATTTLAVPAGNVAGSYKANVTWTLTATPTSTEASTPDAGESNN